MKNSSKEEHQEQREDRSPKCLRFIFDYRQLVRPLLELMKHNSMDPVSVFFEEISRDNFEVLQSMNAGTPLNPSIYPFIDPSNRSSIDLSIQTSVHPSIDQSSQAVGQETSKHSPLETRKEFFKRASQQDEFVRSSERPVVDPFGEKEP